MSILTNSVAGAWLLNTCPACLIAQSAQESEGAVTVGWVAPSITSRAEIP